VLAEFASVVDAVRRAVARGFSGSDPDSIFAGLRKAGIPEE
jgi:hypothetical protein